MDKGYCYQREGANPSKNVGWWFLSLSVAIPWLGIYLVMSWLWK